ncbi:hypothetical protein HanPSC8_Chr11g0487021 [Helianthus annuus]|nr:hypothetical protein HanPSC8_Chr11g0487021 [Helianthus annuus]
MKADPLHQIFKTLRTHTYSPIPCYSLISLSLKNLRPATPAELRQSRRRASVASGGWRWFLAAAPPLRRR